MERAGQEIMAAIKNAILNDTVTDEVKDKCLKNLSGLKIKIKGLSEQG